MDDFFMSVPITSTKNICISQLTGEMARLAGAAKSLASGGFFVYATTPDAPMARIDILAKAASLDAAVTLGRLIAAAAQATGINRTHELFASETALGL
jgi:hypothetical protein